MTFFCSDCGETLDRCACEGKKEPTVLVHAVVLQEMERYCEQWLKANESAKSLPLSYNQDFYRGVTQVATWVLKRLKEVRK